MGTKSLSPALSYHSPVLQCIFPLKAIGSVEDGGLRNREAWASIPHPYLSGPSPDVFSAEVCSFLVGCSFGTCSKGVHEKIHAKHLTKCPVERSLLASLAVVLLFIKFRRS